jgi:hypothetical protein
LDGLLDALLNLGGHPSDAVFEVFETIDEMSGHGESPALRAAAKRVGVSRIGR